jgi:hypothetical protein
MNVITRPTLPLDFNIRSFADQYVRHQTPSDKAKENELVRLKSEILVRGYLTKSDLAKIASWKAPRIAGHVQKNDEKYVIEITRFSFATENERVRIESLTLLDGVSWSMATVILHFFHRNRYPIIDFRAIKTISLSQPKQYDFEFWWRYVEFCRRSAEAFSVDMRTLDRALWQYSKDNGKQITYET